MSAWLCSPCALEGKLAVTGGAAGAAGAGGSAVCIRLSRCAAAALGELTALLLASPAAWVDQLLSALALILVGRGRDAPLAAAALQRTVLLAHLFGVEPALVILCLMAWAAWSLFDAGPALAAALERQRAAAFYVFFIVMALAITGIIAP